MNLTTEYKHKVVAALKEQRELFGGSAENFARRFNINGSVFSRLLKGEIDGLLSDAKWLNIGRVLNVSLKQDTWKIVKTDVFNAIESDLINCQEHGISLMFVDECEIGKTVAAKYLSQKMKNVFYVDCSQSKRKTQFIKAIASTLGIETTGRIAEIKANIKYYLSLMEKPVVIFDEAGDLDYAAFLEVKEFWNAAEYNCGFYLIGADGLEAKIKRGIGNKKVGYREIFSRFGSKYMSIVPTEKTAKQAFYIKLITDVVSANTNDKSKVQQIVKKCLTSDLDGHIAGLRRAKTIQLLGQ